MVKNTKGGSRHKRAKNYVAQTEKIVMREENEDEHYAYVSRAYGNGQFGVRLVTSNNDSSLGLTEKEYRGRISGRMRKQKFRNFVRANDLVLIAKRDFQTCDDKVDIIHVYKHDVVKKLAKMGQVPIIENLQDGSPDSINTNIIFAYDNEDEEEDGGGGGGGGGGDNNTPGTSSTNTGVNNGMPGIGGGTSGSANDWQIDVSDI